MSILINGINIMRKRIYNKIEENLNKVMPLESILKKARTVENLHELIKNNGKNFELNSNEKELAEMLAN